jgi:hypothetical protein
MATIAPITRKNGSGRSGRNFMAAFQGRRLQLSMHSLIVPCGEATYSLHGSSRAVCTVDALGQAEAAVQRPATK